MRVLSCNIRTSDAPDGVNGWSHRGPFCMEIMRAREADVIACQEVTQQQLADLIDAFPEFGHYALRDGRGPDHPSNAVLFRHDTTTLLSGGGYWLSARPHVAGTRSWGSLYVRTAVWLRLSSRADGTEFRVINTHLDVVSDFTRFRQIDVIRDEAAAYPDDHPQILTGDLNATPASAAVRSMLSHGWRDAWTTAHPDRPGGRTYHAFLGDHAGDSAASVAGDPTAVTVDQPIDHILVRGEVTVRGCEVVREQSMRGLYPSDHYFLQADLELG